MKRETYAILLMDLVDSTDFLQKFSAKFGLESSARVIFNHDKHVRSLITFYRGREIDKTDGFLIIFNRTIDAVNFAMKYNEIVPKKTGLRSRIGIHWGEVILKKNREIVQ